MADSKITALTSIGTSTDPVLDQMVIVDVSDGSMAATGTTKKVSLNQLLSSNPSATGGLTLSGALAAGSATITGDLTVDTSTLKVDSALNKVGIGVATLTGLSTLNVAGDIAITSDLVLKNSGGTAQGYLFGSSGINYRVIAGQPHVWQEGGSDLMRLNSTGLGVGVTPAGTGGCLQLKSGITFPATQVASSDANTLDDYEEGTWTGTLTGGTTNPTTPVTATGRYTKVGRIVTVQISFSNVDTTGASGIIGITGLPFTNNASAGSVGSVILYSIGTFTGSPFASLGLSESFIKLFSNNSNSVFTDVTHNAGATRYLTTSITYTVA